MEEQNELLKTLVRQKNSEINDISEDAKNTNELESKKNKAKEITVKHRESQKIERISISFWKKMKDEHGEGAFDIIEYHE